MQWIRIEPQFFLVQLPFLAVAIPHFQAHPVRMIFHPAGLVVPLLYCCEVRNPFPTIETLLDWTCEKIGGPGKWGGTRRWE